MRQVAVLLLLVFSATAQTPPPVPDAPAPLVYAGTPLRVPVACTEDDMQGLGMSCTSEAPCAVYLELSALEVLAGRMVLAGNLHTNSTTLSSIVLASEDGGKTWTESHPRIRQAVLDRMQFFDLANGWISGQVIGALPRDPFFLVTIDGGKTRRRRPVFSDSHLGSIENFLFTSATDGRVLVDRAQSSEGGRYAVLDSRTGGESWGIVQITTDRPSKEQFSRPPSAAWRLQADAAAKAYQVQKREGAKWTPVVSFLVAAGSCAPEEIQLTPPPEPPPAVTSTDAVDVFQIGGPKSKTTGPKKKK